MPSSLRYVLVALVVIVPAVVVIAFISRHVGKPRLASARTFGMHRGETEYHLEYCYYCGAPMPTGAMYCKKCGRSQG